MKLADVQPGDVLLYWYDDGWHGSVGYVKVIRVNRVTITADTESHGRGRFRIGMFQRKVDKKEWSPWNPGGG